MRLIMKRFQHYMYIRSIIYTTISYYMKFQFFFLHKDEGNVESMYDTVERFGQDSNSGCYSTLS